MSDNPRQDADAVRRLLGPPVEDSNPETKQFERVQDAELVRVEYDTARCTVCGGEIRHRWRDARDSWFHSTIPGSFWTLHAALATGVTPESGSISSRAAREKLQIDGSQEGRTDAG